jgi:hypothetical protein
MEYTYQINVLTQYSFRICKGTYYISKNDYQSFSLYIYFSYFKFIRIIPT